MSNPFKAAVAACRLGNGPTQEEGPEDWDDSGRDMRCAICRDEMCACGNVYDCEHGTDERHGWTPLTTEYLESGQKRPWRNGAGPWVIRDAEDGRYIGREPDGDTSAIQCWPSKLNRHVMHFPTEAAARGYIEQGYDPQTRSPRYLRVRPIRSPS